MMFVVTSVMSGVRSVRLEQKREKYLRRQRQLSDVQIGVSQMLYIRRRKTFMMGGAMMI